jgi:DNA-directed RNA polymerase subunit RPC12/RpoP
MAGRDYILCRDCGDKLIYDGSDNIRSRLEENYGDPAACDWTVELVCPPCLKKIEDKQAEPAAAWLKNEVKIYREGE